MALIELTPSECRFLAHMLEAPDALFDEEMGFDEDQFEARCWELQAQLAGQRLNVEPELDREIVYRSAAESTYMADAGAEDSRTVVATLSKVANGLEAKLSAALGRPVTIPRS